MFTQNNLTIINSNGKQWEAMQNPNLLMISLANGNG
jgi:hypothetical protein